MNYKSYPTSFVTPSRMARKRMRRDVFTHNKKAHKLTKKAARLERKSHMEEIDAN